VTPKVGPATAADIKDSVAAGVKIGYATIAELVIARSNGVPVKIVASPLGESVNRIYVKADSPIKTGKDLDGKKVGVGTASSGRQIAYLSSKLTIKAESVILVNLTNQIASLKAGNVDAILSSDGKALKFVDSGELRMLMRIADVFPKPYGTGALYATEDLIQ